MKKLALKKRSNPTLNFGEHSPMFIALGFLLVILVGSFLLALPGASRSGRSIGWFDALFESTSCVCVTGLIVRDTATTFTSFGKIVLIVLIQIGGLGFMTFTMIVARILRRKISLAERMMLRDSVSSTGIGDALLSLRWVIQSAFVVELAGACVLSIRFIPLYGLRKGAAYSLFHAISAFCNAGFDLFGNYKSLMDFRADVFINLTAIALIVVGGIGFSVIREVIRYRKTRHFSVYAKIVLTGYFSFLLFGWVFTLFAEWSNPGTLGELPLGEKILASLFQSVTLRTAGFNTIDEAALRPATKLVSCILMIIGCAPASTGGGIKITTVAVILLSVLATAKGQENIVVDRKNIAHDVIRRALAVTLLATGVFLLNTVVISMLQPELDFMEVMFECASAIGTVGISAFGSASLHTIPRILIIISMFLGRIGPLSAAIILSKRGGKSSGRVRYPDANIIIG